ncbi:MAG: hypothetical protein AAB438_02550, partial [Patescibacteria group bacterium]
MKKFTKSLLAVAIVLGSVLFSGNTAFAATPGYVSSSVTGVTQTSAIFNGTFNPSSLSTTAWFEMQNGGGQQYGTQNIGSGSGNVAINPAFTKTGLTPSTTYSFRAVAQNQTGTTYGPWISFTTTAQQQQVTVNVWADDTSINAGSSTVVHWSSTNATSCTSSSLSGWLMTMGQQTVWPTQTKTYTVTCTNGSSSDSASVTVTVNQQQNPANILTFTATPNSVAFGGSTTLNWTVQNATSCTAGGAWSGPKNITGGSQTINNLTINPTVFTLNCTGLGGSDFAQVSVTVGAQQGNAPAVTVNVSPTSITSGNFATLTWSATNNPTSCSASWTNNSIATSGSLQVSPNVSTNYTVTCFNNFGSGNDSAFLTVNQQVNAPTVNISASPTSVFSGGSSVITWVVSNATQCVGTNGSSGWSGFHNANGGSFVANDLTTTTTFTLTCTGPGGSSANSVTVGVTSNPVNLPTVNLSANQTNIQYSGSTNLTWTVNNATSCNATNGTNGWSGPKSTSGGTFFTG